jgi:hypothetical protein
MNLDERFNVIKMQYNKISDNLEKYKHNSFSVEYLNKQKEKLDNAIENILLDCSMDDIQFEINDLQDQRTQLLEKYKNTYYTKMSNDDANKLLKLNEKLVYLSNIKRSKN